MTRKVTILVMMNELKERRNKKTRNKKEKKEKKIMQSYYLLDSLFTIPTPSPLTNKQFNTSILIDDDDSDWLLMIAPVHCHWWIIIPPLPIYGAKF